MPPRKDYDVGPFTDVEARWGDRLWSFLTELEMRRAMVRASDEGRPAAEAIAVTLYDRFGERVKQDRVKQFVGYLIRQVMERHGYQYVDSGIVTRPNPVFSTAATYSRRKE